MRLAMRPVAALFLAPSCLLEVALGLSALTRAGFFLLAGFGYTRPGPALMPLGSVAPLTLWGVLFAFAGAWQLVALGRFDWWPRIAALYAACLWWWQAWLIAQMEPSVWWGPHAMVVTFCVLIAVRTPSGEALWTLYRRL